jgi:acetyl esterase/lipase
VDDSLLKLKKEWIAEMEASPGIPLWPRGETPRFVAEYGQPEPSVVPFLLEKGDLPRGAVVVCPGGGYEFKAPHEGRPIARWLNSVGISAFVLDYRVAPYTLDCPVMDVKRAIRLVRHKAAEWGVNPEKIGVLGFSAGGHLSIMVSEQFDGGDPDSADPVERESCRPDAQVPCYPAVSFAQFSRQKDAQDWLPRLLGPGYTEEDAKTSSGELRVRADTPPAFIWGTWDDFLYEQWPPLLKALKKKNVEYAFHMFPRGGHGMGLAQGNPLASQWPGLCVAWLKDLGF